MVTSWESPSLCFKRDPPLARTDSQSISRIFILFPHTSLVIFYYCITWNHFSAECPFIMKYLSRASEVLQTITLIYSYLKFLLALLTNYKNCLIGHLKGDHWTKITSQCLVWVEYMYTYMHTDIHMYICSCTHTFMHTHNYMYSYSFVYIFAHIHIYIHTHM